MKQDHKNLLGNHRSNKKYERDMRLTMISYIGLIITILLILINENI